MADSPGHGLARRFYTQAVAPALAGTPHAAALLGNGSEVLGYDHEVSTDHDFAARVRRRRPRDRRRAVLIAHSW